MSAARRYAFEHEKPERLRGLEVTWDPGTEALLERLGIRARDQCLEAGAGGGSIAAWMAERVGPGGHVLATDVDPTHLEPLAGDVLEVRRHDVLADDLPDAAFDVVHARSLVSWLGESDAVARLAATLRPGGVLVLEDFDWAIGGPGDDAPAAAAKVYRAILGLLERIGYDLRFGSTLLARLDRVGLDATGSEGRSFVLPGGSPGTAFERFSVTAQRDALVASAGVTGAEIDETLRYLADPTSHVLTPVLYAAWGRRPTA